MLFQKNTYNLTPPSFILQLPFILLYISGQGLEVSNVRVKLRVISLTHEQLKTTNWHIFE